MECSVVLLSFYIFITSTTGMGPWQVKPVKPYFLNNPGKTQLLDSLIIVLDYMEESGFIHQ